MRRLHSHVGGQWIRPHEEGLETLVNPATEEPLAQLGEPGCSLPDALEYAIRTGRPALQGMTFASRAKLLRDISVLLQSKRDELIAISIENGGNTRGDAKFDIDGATITLTAYADLGEELGPRNVLWDEETVPLGRSKRFVGRHLQVAKGGVALHINASNFPAWGLAEKLATALLAGMPVVTKPATETALLAHRIFELILEAGILPPGTFSLVTGRKPVGLIEGLRPQDVLAFTGCGDTALEIRRQVPTGVSLNVETDSINAVVLDPNARDACFGMFLRDIVTEMTQKAGQKCTATRRIVVPAHLERSVVDELCAALARIKVGNPALPEVNMGPLASERLLDHVRRGLKKLKPETEALFGGNGEIKPLGVPQGKGFFVGPVLLRASNPFRAREVHETEVFGPVATILVYDGTPEEASQLVAMGGGSLVTSIYSDDEEFSTDLALSVLPWGGRLYLANSKLDGHAMSPGTVLPQLIHGGPGRAGGGEELGGLRGLSLYMHRTAVAGDHAALRDAYQGNPLGG